MNEKNTSHSSITLTGDSLTIQDLVAVARSQARVAPLQPSDRAVESWQWVKQVSDGGLHDENGHSLAVYSINTPFGSRAFESVFETPEQSQWLSRNLITSHSAGV
ncbi:MAG: aromatic amino acid lyase, partial [Anaerolineae bacterium]